MSHRNLAAWTPPGIAPPYVSINEDAEGRVMVTVRSAPDVSGECNYAACATMPADDFATFLEQLIQCWRSRPLREALSEPLCNVCYNRLDTWPSCQQDACPHKGVAT